MIPDVSNIKGWLFDDEPQWLYDQAREVQGDIIEIGSYQGKSTICLAQGLIDGHGGTLYAIDPQYIGGMTGYRQLITNLKTHGVRDHVEVFLCRADQARDYFDNEMYPMVFIDGEHDYINASRDIGMYLPKVKSGGIIAVHDCNSVYPGVMRAVNEHIGDYPECFAGAYHRAEGSRIAWARKR